MNKKRIIFFITLGSLFVASSLFFLTPAPVNAQCGSQASSCKNCHETQGQDPVNNDGTTWHSEHAFGDFCYLCHGGNNQATDKTAAHTGMIAPLVNIVTNCKGCHPTDYEAKAQIYATTLGQQIGTGGSTTPAASSQAASTPVSATTGAAPNAQAVVVPAADMVDYSQRYDQVVLGNQPVNWGNIILIAMILALVVGGGGFVILRERLVKVSFGDTKKIEGEYPSDILAMLPAIVGLKPQARKGLKSILDNPSKSEKVLGLIDEVITDKKTKE